MTGKWCEWVLNDMNDCIEIICKTRSLFRNDLKRPEWCWNEWNDRGFMTWVKFGAAEIEASYWSRAHNRGFWLVERGWIPKFKASAFRPEIPLFRLISASFKHFWSFSWPEQWSHFAVIRFIQEWDYNAINESNIKGNDCKMMWMSLEWD